MRAFSLLVAAPLVVVGAVFTGQGLGLIPGSFMTGSLFWAIVGMLMLAAGATIVFVAARRG